MTPRKDPQMKGDWKLQKYVNAGAALRRQKTQTPDRSEVMRKRLMICAFIKVCPADTSLNQ